MGKFLRAGEQLCDCGRVATVSVRVEVGTAQRGRLRRVSMPLCAACHVEFLEIGGRDIGQRVLPSRAHNRHPQAVKKW